jgi:TRAP-type mannitol/chloroaromatic compound transport system permease large subunit
MNNIFTKHPHSIGETYLEHMKKALNTTIKVQLVVFIILTHAIFPFLFEHLGSDEIEKINDELQHRRNNE